VETRYSNSDTVLIESVPVQTTDPPSLLNALLSVVNYWQCWSVTEVNCVLGAYAPMYSSVVLLGVFVQL